MVKFPRHWEKPDSSKGRSATQERDLKPGNVDLKVGRDQDWIRAAKTQGMGFSGNAVGVNRYRDNPAAGEYRSPKEHVYKVTNSGTGSGEQRIETQNRLAGRKK